MKTLIALCLMTLSLLVAPATQAAPKPLNASALRAQIMARVMGAHLHMLGLEAPVVQASGVELDGATLLGHGLEPGHVYYASFAFTPDDGSAGFNLGWSYLRVKSDGTIAFPNDTTDVDPRNVPGTLTAWLHEGQSFGEPPAMGPDGTTLRATTHLGGG